MADSAYDDKLTPEEEAAAAAFEKDNTPPPADSSDAAPAAPPPAADPKDPAAPAADPAAPAAEPTADDAELKAFLEKHKDKSPEELARLAYQQEKRAQREGFSARKVQENLGEIVKRAGETLAARRADIAARRAAFDQTLKDDPDAAAKQVHDRLLRDELSVAETEAHQARVDAAITFAETYIPDFRQDYPQIHAFGQEIGYTPQELGSISDGRDIVVLNLARVAGNLIKAGIIDARGQFLKAPEAVATEPTDPRLRQPTDPLRTLGSAPARSNGGAKTLETQLRDIANLSDADFAKLDSETLENLLRQAN